ncbi:hypothetical protein [Rickettsiella grylli]|uniref:Uncharacterized protein n=1 Tax=Rickettsiella grylli TaxID=59196 RepID=A8PLZ5_9COXI|nr:hypothetical protein [Rickettsiella grylli]EDP45843.1 hypothetical protein RICGR_0582 [Rickettsiella grylli]
MFRSLAIALFILLLLIMGGHIALALFTGAAVISFSVWGFLVASVFFFSLSILLLFILTWAGVLIIGAIAALWTIVAIILFPILLPVLLPLLIILFFISYVRRKQNPKEF